MQVNKGSGILSSAKNEPMQNWTNDVIAPFQIGTWITEWTAQKETSQGTAWETQTHVAWGDPVLFSLTHRPGFQYFDFFYRCACQTFNFNINECQSTLKLGK